MPRSRASPEPRDPSPTPCVIPAITLPVDRTPESTGFARHCLNPPAERPGNLDTEGS
jgi:hypothetical protein